MPHALSPGTRFTTDVPPRLDRLPWSRWHWRVVVALGITWALDGLEVTLVGSIAAVLAEPGTLHLGDAQIGATATAYLAGAFVGALLFGRLTDLFGRKRLFVVTLAIYVGATLLTAFSWGFVSFLVFRALTGAGIGGEYSAVNSAIDELIPARVRGRTDLAINSTYWIGTALGAGMTLLLLDTPFLPHRIAWRTVFLLGGAIGSAILVVRKHVPESPRWLLLHGRIHDAERTVASIEREVSRRGARLPEPGPPREMVAKGAVTFASIARVLFRRHLRRTLLGLTLMTAQAFAYNGIFFTYALVLGHFYGVPAGRVGLYLLPFALGNLAGPLVLGHLFDTVGRRPMIAITYALAGALIALTGFLMMRGYLTAATQTLLWCVVFFVASAAASSAYLTVSELFPVELRGMAIALFYALGTGVGGLGAPALFGLLLESGDRAVVAIGYFVGALLMITAGATAAFLAVAAERRSLEQLADAPR
jgi:MFS family permease